MQEVVRIILPNHFDKTTVNSWLLKGEVNTLVDTGMKSDQSWEALIAQLGEQGLAITDIQKIVITHGHADHMGLAARIAEASGAKVWVPEYLYPWTYNLADQINRRSGIYDDAFFTNTDLNLFPYVSWGADKLMQFWDPLPKDQVEVFANDAKIQLGSSYWQTVYTPGHCVNQVVFYQPEGKQLLSADMILKSTPVPYLDAQIDNPKIRTQSLTALLASFERLRQLDIDHVYPGHFDTMGDPSELIRKQVNRIEQNIDKCLDWIIKGNSTFDSIIHHLYPNRVNDSTFFMVIALLDHLTGTGRIKSIKVKDKFQYFPSTEIVHSGTSRKLANNEF